ncbi:MAG: hypothetical protein N838_09700 [Thiohalocapsa sp. PB-PSB1]|nr:MAG: hypothetical protein N838_09700 [Thiohalocapsa sp. PB-PSB1]HCS92353.1 hypothetical protein [Chromatiaceae bacterium]
MVMRRQHDSVQTERGYCDWITRFVKFHGMRSRQQVLGAGVARIETFLIDLAEKRKVSASRQNQMFNASLFLYGKVSKKTLEGWIDAARSSKEPRPPVVLRHEKVAKVLPLIDGQADLVIRLLYGSGLCITEAVQLRKLDMDFGYKQIKVRFGKGNQAACRSGTRHQNNVIAIGCAV